MRRMIPLVVSLLVIVPPLGAQSDSGHVWLVGQWRAYEGHERTFSQALAEVSRPVLDFMVENGDIVSYLHLELADVREAGEGEPTHLLIVELPARDVLDTWTTRYIEAKWAVFGREASDELFARFEQHRLELSLANPWISTVP